jgi:hypothetical protein
MTDSRSLTWLACLLATSMVHADEHDLPFGNTDACMQGPLAQFGQYIGDWHIEDSQLAKDGSGWQPGKGARWIFSCLGNGTAIQDFWLPANGAVGTNLRTYDPETGTWEIAWAVDRLPGFAHIRAAMNAEGNIVMNYVAPLPTPLRRITFFPADEHGWHWQLELSNDDGATWTEVYRIKATPYAGPD